jgi:hypothetical protein
MFDKITTEAMKITQRDKKKTLSAQSIHTAYVFSSATTPFLSLLFATPNTNMTAYAQDSSYIS